jgi:hypothetical protein
MSHEDVPYEDSLDRIRAWVHRNIYPRPASSVAVAEALVTVLSRSADAHLDRFLARSPAVISLPSVCVAIVLWDDEPTASMPPSRAPLILFNTLLWPDQGALQATRDDSRDCECLPARTRSRSSGDSGGPQLRPGPSSPMF